MSQNKTKKSVNIAVISVLVTLLMAAAAVSFASKSPKPWSPRKDCTGVYGTKGKDKVTTVTLADLIKTPAKYKGKMLQVKGEVKAACKFKGCWMIMTDGKNKMRVRFKGYGFFVPTNSAGYGAVAVGKAKLKTISVKMLRHYAMDAGKPEMAKKITKPKTTVAFTAHWVALHKTKPAKTAKPAKRK